MHPRACFASSPCTASRASLSSGTADEQDATTSTSRRARGRPTGTRFMLCSLRQARVCGRLYRRAVHATHSDEEECGQSLGRSYAYSTVYPFGNAARFAVHPFVAVVGYLPEQCGQSATSDCRGREEVLDTVLKRYIRTARFSCHRLTSGCAPVAGAVSLVSAASSATSTTITPSSATSILIA